MNQNKIAFVLEGGAMRGLYTVGVLDTFMKNGINTHAILGVSAGALFGINFKSKQMGRALRYNLKYAHDKRYMSMYSLLTTGDIMNKKFCFDDIIYKLDKFDFETFNSSPIDFFAVVTNLETGKAEYIKIDDAHSKLEYLRASGSMPFVSNIVNIDGNKYLDGAISDSIPIEKAIEMGYEKIIVVLTRPLGYRKSKPMMPYDLWYKKYPNFINVGKTYYKKYNEVLDMLVEYEKQEKIVVLRPSVELNIQRVEKNLKKLQAIYDLGVKDCNDKLDIITSYLSSSKKVTL